MQIYSTAEQTMFNKLNCGDIFTGRKADGSPFLGMKVATRALAEDDPHPDVVVFNENKPPYLYNGAWMNERPQVVKLTNLAFQKRPQKPTDVITDIKNSSDARGRVGAGCLYLYGDAAYLGVEVKFQSHAEQTFYVNVESGDCWHTADAGSLDMRGPQAGKQFNLLRDGAALPRWSILETDAEKLAVISYEVPGAAATKAA